MRLRFVMGIILCLVLVFTVSAADKAAKAKAPKLDRLDGRIQMINKDTKTITLDVKGIKRQVVYSDATKYTFRNKPGTTDDVKEGKRAIVLGKFNDKTQLEATRIDIREK